MSSGGRTGNCLNKVIRDVCSSDFLSCRVIGCQTIKIRKQQESRARPYSGGEHKRECVADGNSWQAARNQRPLVCRSADISPSKKPLRAEAANKVAGEVLGLTQLLVDGRHVLLVERKVSLEGDGSGMGIGLGEGAVNGAIEVESIRGEKKFVSLAPLHHDSGDTRPPTSRAPAGCSAGGRSGGPRPAAPDTSESPTRPRLPAPSNAAGRRNSGSRFCFHAGSIALRRPWRPRRSRNDDRTGAASSLRRAADSGRRGRRRRFPRGRQPFLSSSSAVRK